MSVSTYIYIDIDMCVCAYAVHACITKTRRGKQQEANKASKNRKLAWDTFKTSIFMTEMQQAVAPFPDDARVLQELLAAGLGGSDSTNQQTMHVIWKCKMENVISTQSGTIQVGAVWREISHPPRFELQAAIWRTDNWTRAKTLKGKSGKRQ